jgi:MFS family permease
LIIASVTAIPLAAAALVAYGVGTSTGAVTFNSMLQAEAPEHARGRVFASMDVLWLGGRLVSLAVGGLLADRYGIQVVYCLGGLLLIAAAAVGFLAGARAQHGEAARHNHARRPGPPVRRQVSAALRRETAR